MARAVVIYAHPYPDRSRANRVLFDAVRSLPGVDARPIYDLYPEFWVDVRAEQAALSRADVVVWQHPIYWYSAPALLKLWWEKVLTHGWAYGKGGEALWELVGDFDNGRGSDVVRMSAELERRDGVFA